MNQTYRITRFFFLSRKRRTIATGVTLDEARKHCQDPETSSSTAVSANAKRRTKKYGPWFDGFVKES